MFAAVVTLVFGALSGTLVPLVRFASSSDSTNGRIFYIENESEVEIVDLKLDNGYLYSSSSGVYLYSSSNGGAIYLTGWSTLEMTRCTLSTNTIHSASVSQYRLLVLRVISCVILSHSLTHSLITINHCLATTFMTLVVNSTIVHTQFTRSITCCYGRR